jgi:hypothetical protein
MFPTFDESKLVLCCSTKIYDYYGQTGAGTKIFSQDNFSIKGNEKTLNRICIFGSDNGFCEISLYLDATDGDLGEMYEIPYNDKGGRTERIIESLKNGNYRITFITGELNESLVHTNFIEIKILGKVNLNNGLNQTFDVVDSLVLISENQPHNEDINYDGDIDSNKHIVPTKDIVCN